VARGPTRRGCRVVTGQSVCVLSTFVGRSAHFVVSLHVGPVSAERRGAELHHDGGDAAGDAGAVADGGPDASLRTVGPSLLQVVGYWCASRILCCDDMGELGLEISVLLLLPAWFGL
jgi:hypothetical protein